MRNLARLGTLVHGGWPGARVKHFTEQRLCHMASPHLQGLELEGRQ